MQRKGSVFAIAGLSASGFRQASAIQCALESSSTNIGDDYRSSTARPRVVAENDIATFNILQRALSEFAALLDDSEPS
jgi:hypothetical protein